MNIVTEYPWWSVILCILAGLIYAGALYYRDRRFPELKRFVLYGMSVLRFVVVTVLCLLLLNPLLKSVDRKLEKPIVVLAQDNSESITATADSAYYKGEYKQQLEALKSQLAEKYEVYAYSFGDGVNELPLADSLHFNEKTTNFSNLFDELDTRYSNRNVGAIVIASDGLYTAGNNPLYAANALTVPVYTIALGDTIIKKDVLINNVAHNKTAYLGNDFPLLVTVQAKELKGQKTTLTVSKGDAVLFSQVIDIQTNNYSSSISVLLHATEVGLMHYKVQLSAVDGEMSLSNNRKDVYIDVMDSREKVLILADAPHPDVAALKASLESSQSYDVESYTIDNFQGTVKKYNLVILHQLPGLRNNATKLITDIRAAGIPLWVFSGAAAMLHGDLSVVPANSKTNEVEPVLDNSFPLFTLSDELKKGIRDFPAVNCPYGSFTANNNSNVLLYQRIGVVDTRTPLLELIANDDNKMALFTGEGIWRWRMQDFAANNNTLVFDELVSKIVQYLSIKEDKSFFRITAKNSYLENEPIEMQAEVYNESYELINDPDVNLVIKNESGNKFPFVFSKTDRAYRLNAGNFPAGDYSYEATVKVGDKTYTKKSDFSIRPVQVELTNTVADHQLLFNLAAKHNGSMIYPKHLDDLLKKLNARDDIKTIAYSENHLDDVINLKGIFFLVIVLLALEWFLRKRNGAY